MADKNEMLAEAYRRGLLPPDRKAAYEEAMRRGLVAKPSAIAKAPVGKPAPERKLRWAEVPGEALENLPESAKQYGKGLAQAVLKPLDTLHAVTDTASGALWNAVEDASKKQGGPGVAGPAALAAKGAVAVRDKIAKPEIVARQKQMARDVGTAYDKRFGVTPLMQGRFNEAEGAIKRTIAADPVGFLGDVSTVLGGVGGAAARAPGVIGKFGRAAEVAGRMTDPVNLAMKTVGGAGKLAGKTGAAVLGITTGAGPRAIEEAARVGAIGGRKGQKFREHMRGEAPVEEIVTEARQADSAMRKERNENYRRDMAETKSDPAQLQFDAIESALADVKNRGEYKGKRIDPTAARAWEQIDALVQDWKASDPAEFHTPEGIDALKKAIGNVRDDLEYNTPARNAADAAYKAVRGTITEQVPSYAKAMQGYENSSALLDDINRSLSLGQKNAVDTSVRKLQSLMRNNVNTNYGRRVELGNVLEKYGADTLIPSIAGQALSSLAPRALGGALAGAGAAGLFSVLGPKAALTLAAASPRIVGEVVHGGARVLGKPIQAMGAGMRTYDQLSPLAVAGQQAGRIALGPEGLSAMVERYGRQPAETPEAPAEPQTEEVQAEEPQAEAPTLEQQEIEDRLVMAESNNDPNAVSPVGAVGRWQVMPATLDKPGFGIAPAKDRSDEEISRVGREYFRALLKKHNGYLIPTLAAYNWGPGETDKWLAEGADFDKLPAETQAYIKKILGDESGL